MILRIPDEKYPRLLELLKAGGEETLAMDIEASEAERISLQPYIQKAHDIFYNEGEDQINVDPDALFSVADDWVWVQGWLCVDKDKEPVLCRKCSHIISEEELEELEDPDEEICEVCIRKAFCPGCGIEPADEDRLDRKCPDCREYGI